MLTIHVSSILSFAFCIPQTAEIKPKELRKWFYEFSLQSPNQFLQDTD
jgi:hypothetical protein